MKRMRVRFFRVARPLKKSFCPSVCPRQIFKATKVPLFREDEPRLLASLIPVPALRVAIEAFLTAGLQMPLVGTPRRLH